MAFTQIAYNVEDGIATITLDRPEALNAFTATMMEELIAAFDEVDDDDSVRAVVITGRGRGFCAGADLSSGGSTFDYDEPEDQLHRDGGGLVALRIFECLKPVIAAINGPAVGIGLTMTLPMDIRLVADDAKLGFVFARRGIIPEACSSWFLPRLVGISQAQEWVVTGRIFGPAEALAGGLVRSVHEGDDLLEAAYAIAREIVNHAAPISVALSRQLLWRMLGADHPMEAHKIDSRGIAALGASADANEGVTAFLEKRNPQFAMRPSKDMPAFFPWWDEPEFK